MKITNKSGVSLPLAVWLLHDDYDYIRDENYISATALLKSTKQLVLSRRIPYQEREMDVADFIAARLGHAVHDSMEKAWMLSGKKNMKLLGYPEEIVETILINPTPEEIRANPSSIHIWMEKRVIREITVDGKVFKIGGKYDIVIDGRIFDTKTTSVWSYMSGDKDEDYGKQGSIYRWLNPDLITSDHVYIQFLFTDWQRVMAKTNPKYPAERVLEHPVELLPIPKIEEFIHEKVQELSRLWNADEADIPPCTDKELWRSEPAFKYYSDPTKTDGRSSKNFDNLADATRYWKQDKAGKGIVKTIPGEVKACAYCAAYNICKQREQYDV